jgi:hypothetical protein
MTLCKKLTMMSTYKREEGKVELTMSTTYKTKDGALIDTNVVVDKTADPDLFRVFVERAYIGTVRREDGEGWTPIGGFIMDLRALPDMSGYSRSWDKGKGREVVVGPRTQEPPPPPLALPRTYAVYKSTMVEAVNALVVAWLERLFERLVNLQIKRGHNGHNRHQEWRD